LGNTGLSVSALGLGCNGLGAWIDPDEGHRIIRAALDAGITFFDTADSYGLTQSEVQLGQALGRQVNDVVIATKIGQAVPEAGLIGGASKAWIEEATEGSLRRLGRDRIDLLQLHFPDPATPWEETLTALDRLRHDGKVRAVGVCNLTPDELRDAVAVGRNIGTDGLASIQFEWSAVSRDAEAALVPAARVCGLGLLPYFPLCQGILTGKYCPSAPLPEQSRLARWGDMGRAALGSPKMSAALRLADYAKGQGISLIELALGWLLAQDGIASIPVGASTAAQVRENARAVGWKPTPADIAAIDEITLRQAAP
jgi:aryl-alcohol dehydrogenase-like predicted oxidoreductase